MDESNILSSALVLFITMFLVYWKITKRRYKLPPGPTGVPVLGYIPFLGTEPFKTLNTLKEKYGNVFSINLGLTHVVILGDYKAVKDAFSKPSTTDRPHRLFDFLPDGVGISSVNGSEWVEQRKFCMKNMRDFGLGKSKWESMLQAEIEEFTALVSSYKGQNIEISQVLSSSVSNNISSFVFGKRFPSNDPIRKFLDAVLDDLTMAFNQDNLFNFFPVIRDACVALNIGESAKTYHKFQKFNNFVKEEARKIKASYQSEPSENFIADYLKEIDCQKDKAGQYFNDTNLHGNVQALFIGGSETTRTSIYWLLLIMAKFPKIQTKVHEELDSVLGKNGRIQWSERNKIPYTYAVIMEGQRWRTIAPLNTARLAMEDIEIQGYDVPKGTTIIANNWGLHHDKKYWKDSEIFDPNRFIAEDGKVILKPESYVPFSYGKRNCPAETIALMEILLYFVALVQKFTILPPKNWTLNMGGKLGITYQPVKQELQFIQRE